MGLLNLELLAFLSSERAEASIQALVQQDLRDSALLQRIGELRREFPPEQASALLEQARLRLRAAPKFGASAGLLFEAEALQQASSLSVAQYRAQRFQRFQRVADLGCGIGADTLALAQTGRAVLAVERDPLRARICEINVARSGLSAQVEVRCADWTALALHVDAAFADPARRSEGRRVFGLQAMEPPLPAILELCERVAHVAVKVAPGVAYDEIPAQAEVELISEAGELKEALLLFGGLKRGAARTATLLPEAISIDSNAVESQAPARQPEAYLYEPDPAVIRATLVRHLAAQIGAFQIDPQIAYLTSPQPVRTPFARSWQVLRHGGFHLKTLNQWLREAGAGEVVVKKRGAAIDPDEFRRRLKTVPGGVLVTVFVTRVLGRPWMILARGNDGT